MPISDLIIIILISLSIILLVILIILVCVKFHVKGNNDELFNKLTNDLIENFNHLGENISNQNISYINNIKTEVIALQTQIGNLINNEHQEYITLSAKLDESYKTLFSDLKMNNEDNFKSQKDTLSFFQEQINNAVTNYNNTVSNNLTLLTNIVKERLNDIEKNVLISVDNIRQNNEHKLDLIKEIVEEKIQKTLNDQLKQSFDNVIAQIADVNKAIGEIKGIATDVSSLKIALTNVKTKGIIGEVILGNLIGDILVKEQYLQNVATKKNSKDVVEFAIKIPNLSGNDILLPVDSKFPLSSYYKIKEGVDKGDSNVIQEARKELKNNIKSFAKDIANKYLDYPYTTDFGIMFLPNEGLYAEVINLGVTEEIQKDYHISIVGPSTFAAFLNSLQMGYKSIAIEKKSGDIFKLLGEVKTEFSRFASALNKTKKKIDEAGNELDNLVGTRTRMLENKLKNIDSIPVTIDLKEEQK